MKVENNFPDIDKVLRNLKDFVSFLKESKENSQEELDKEIAEDGLKKVEDFTESISNYLDNICNGPKRIEREKEKTDDLDAIRDFIENEDKKRTSNHSRIIMSMIMIDRYAQMYKRDLVFGYEEEYLKDYSHLIANSPEEKSKMSERDRIKRRELGNFGLYIAAGVTAGLELDEKEIRDFASAESDSRKCDPLTLRKVTEKSSGVKTNMDAILK